MPQNKLVSNTLIYLDSRKLLDVILDVTPNFPRQYKFTIGNKMHDLAVDLMSDISAAYINRDRATRIQQLTKYWLVTVEQQGNEILIKLYAK